MSSCPCQAALWAPKPHGCPKMTCFKGNSVCSFLVILTQAMLPFTEIATKEEEIKKERYLRLCLFLLQTTQKVDVVSQPKGICTMTIFSVCLNKMNKEEE